jgi:acyl-CoA thioesterase
MQFDDYLRLACQDEPMTIHPSWGQGRTTFGGLSAALLLERLITVAGNNRPLRSINVNFCGPLFTDTPFDLNHQILSDGKSIAQFSGQAIQNDKVATQLTACFGIERDSEVQLSQSLISLGEPGVGQHLGYIKGLTPEFVQHVDFRYVKGGFPFSNNPSHILTGWVRFNTAPLSFTESYLVALVDAWPPAVLQQLKTPAPCASVTWSLETVHPISLLDEPLTPDSWIYYECEIKQAHHGYAHTVASIYHPNGQLLALSRQLVAVYDKR